MVLIAFDNKGHGGESLGAEKVRSLPGRPLWPLALQLEVVFLFPEGEYLPNIVSLAPLGQLVVSKLKTRTKGIF